MDLKELNEKLRKLNLPEDQRESIFELIDLKTNYNMENAINRLEASIESLKEGIASNRSEMNTSISNMKWTISLGITIATIVISIVVALVNFFMKK